MNIIEVALSDIIPYENNPRDNAPAVDAVAASIREFGFKNPIIIDKDNVIVAGHTRALAAEKLGLEVVPCIRADDLTEEQVKSFRLADNKTAELAEWDFSKLEAELAELADIDMSEFGFDLGDVEKSLDEIEEAETNEQAEPRCKRGEVWLLGEHRLMCGDSTSEDDLKRLMNGNRADMVFTDPPYGVSIGDKNKMLNSVQKAGHCTENIENDTLDAQELYKILVKAFTNLRENGAADHCSYYVSSPQGGELGMMMMMMMKDAGLPVRHMLIWVKNSATFSLGRLDYDYRHEPIFYTWTDKHIFYGGYNTTVVDDTTVVDKMTKKQLIETIKRLMFPRDDSVVYEDKPRKCDLHPTMKPVKLIARFIINSSKQGDNVVDIFGGSGTTLIACEQLNRVCYTMELDPHYCDVIIDRWEQMTGRKAIKAG